MKFLCINTAGTAVQVALCIDGKIFCKRDNSFKKASEVLFVFVDELLNGGGIKLKDLDFISVCVGPGSFTGIRIGLSMVRIFNQFLSVPVVGVTHMQVLAYNATSTSKDIVTLADAANGFVYVGVFDNAKNELLPPNVLTYEQKDIFLASIDESVELCLERTCDAGGLVAASLAAFNKNDTTDYNGLVPLYVRQSQAEDNLTKRGNA